ncbi:MAG: substrate-binding domain-containing protein [Lachnospira sp.]|uniref:substrate-binding domain-containing protein n=1 Tax=Lachnospira pectinoschiza TaxID=28052 RepID=UPI001B4ABE96|nr:substrate-binding domain-containing protein [Lachnospira pectinoschiza]MBP8836865.1 substrate-binding domain-containing protein [Lachnospira sp.]MCB6143273.1 substrate-binding domain-containing protein [Lachnospira pectinoschiza]MEE0218478.1 substrate-binding domain-containing protein [Lachnospira sp.]HRL56695.1 substrate-binding domain-containing protein [Lachnospira sp.]
MKNWKRFAAVAMSVMCMGTMVACGSSGSASNDSKTGSAGSSSKSQTITVVSREDGSGTRGAFIELFGIEEKDASGKKVDNTTDDATITNSTEVMMTTVAGDEAAIGYTSLGALNSSIKALKVDGAEATAANVKSGTYKISRPFNIATKGTVSEVTQDFINYILSEDGQKIVESNGYISQGNSGAFTSNGASGKIVVAGSSSVTPVMEKLLEAYQKVNTGAKIELQESDSTTGMTAAIDGTCDIGMASRELKDSEKSAGLTNQVIALDGIAVIVNNKNSASNITSEQVKAIFTGETTDWSNVK